MHYDWSTVAIRGCDRLAMELRLAMDYASLGTAVLISLLYGRKNVSRRHVIKDSFQLLVSAPERFGSQ